LYHFGQNLISAWRFVYLQLFRGDLNLMLPASCSRGSAAAVQPTRLIKSLHIPKMTSYFSPIRSNYCGNLERDRIFHRWEVSVRL